MGHRHTSTTAGAPVNPATSSLSVGYNTNSRLKLTTSRTKLEGPPSVTDVASKLTLKYKNNRRIRVATSRTKLEKSSSTNLKHHRSTISEVEEVEEGLATFTEEACRESLRLEKSSSTNLIHHRSTISEVEEN